VNTKTLNTPISAGGRIFELDSMRGLAALGVVVYHHGSHFHTWPLQPLLKPLYEGGWRAVDFFFVLSGFVLARAYWTPKRQRCFWSNSWDRVARLYPLHLLTLLFVAAAQWYLVAVLDRDVWIYHLTSVPDFILNLLLIHGLDSSFNGPSWSISTEFVTNILFFCAILLPRRVALAVFLVAIVSASFAATDGAAGSLIPVARTLRGFLLGVLLQRTSTTAGWVYISDNHRLWDGLFFAGLVTFLAFCYLPINWFDGAFTILISILLIASAPRSSVGRWLLNRAPLIYLGEISYSVYLVHFPLQLALWLLYAKYGLVWPFDAVSGLTAFLLATVLCASLSYHFVELPGKNLLWPKRPAANRHAVSLAQVTSDSRTDAL
jgi:peptidoglycan/LPS O-acetylase OafA/YrhL